MTLMLVLVMARRTGDAGSPMLGSLAPRLVVDAVRRGFMVLLVAAFLRAGIRLAAAAVAADVDVEPLDPHILLGEPIAEGRQVVEQHLSGGRVVGFDRGGECALVHREFQAAANQARAG